MDEKRPLVQQSDKPLSKPWYKRRKVIVFIVAALAIVAVAVAVSVTVATVVVVKTKSNSPCAKFGNSQDCVTKDSGDDCMWCYNSDGSGKCEKTHDASTGYLPLTCTIDMALACPAYGFATSEDEQSCVTFIPHGRNRTCCWSNPTGNCYTLDPPYGPIGCCFNSCPTVK